MKIDNIYIGTIKIVSNIKWKNDGVKREYYQPIKKSIIYAKVKDNQTFFYDLDTKHKYKTQNDDCNVGDLLVDLREGIIPLKTIFEQFCVTEGKTNITKRKFLKLCNECCHQINKDNK